MDLRRAAFTVLAAAAAAGLAYGLWRTYFRGEEAVIRDRLEALAADVNEGATDGLGLMARAARIGSFFTEDVTIDLGEGSTPIQGRQTLMAMASRLQQRTSAFALAFDDVNVSLTGPDSADVDLTATFTEHGTAQTEPSMDARELAITMRKEAGAWLILRVSVIEPLKKLSAVSSQPSAKSPATKNGKQRPDNCDPES